MGFTEVAGDIKLDAPKKYREVSNNIQLDSPIPSPEAQYDAQKAAPDWAGRYPNLYAATRTAYDIAAPAIEFGAMTVGGIIGTGAGPAGTVGGAALSYAGAKRVTGGVGQALGFEEPEGGLGESLVETAKDVKEGAQYEIGAGALGVVGRRTAEAAGRGVYAVAPKIADWFVGTKLVVQEEAKKLLGMYKKYNQTPLPSEVAGRLGRTLSQIESVLAYTPVSSDVMYNNSAMRLAQMSTMRQGLINKGAPTKQVEMIGNDIRKEATALFQRQTNAKGAELANMVDDFMGRFGTEGEFNAGLKFSETMWSHRAVKKESVDNAWATVKKVLPQGGDDVVRISDTTVSTAEALLKEELSVPAPLQNKQLIQLLDDFVPDDITKDIPGYLSNPAILEKNPHLKEIFAPQKQVTWNGLQAMRSRLQEKIRGIYKSTEGVATAESRIYTALEKQIEADMSRYAESQGGNIAQAYSAARTATRELHEVYDKDLLRVMNKSPEQILRHVIGRKDITLLNAINEATDGAGLEPLRQGFFKQVLEGAQRDGVFSSKHLGRQLKRMGDDLLNALATPEQVGLLKEISRKGVAINERLSGMKTMEFLETIMGTSNQAIVNLLIKPNNTYNVRMARRMLSPARMTEVKQSTIEHVLKTTSEGNMLPVSAAKEFNRLSEPLRALLTKEEFAGLKGFIEMGQHAKRVEQLALNASHTGQVVIAHGAMQTAVSRPWKLISTLGIPWVLAKMYTSPQALRLFTTAIKLPPSSQQAIQGFARALEITYADNKEKFDEKIATQP